MINFAEEERNGGENRGISRSARRLTSQITYDRLEENDGRLIERNNKVLRGWMGRRGSNGGCLSGIKFRTMFAVQASAPKRAVVCRAAPFATLSRLVPRAYLLANVHTREDIDGYRCTWPKSYGRNLETQRNGAPGRRRSRAGKYFGEKTGKGMLGFTRVAESGRAPVYDTF